MKNIFCGIDFGTSNSAVAITAPDGVKLAAVEGGSVTIPSTIFIPGVGEPLFGRAAIEAYVARTPGRFMRSLKRVLGTSLMREGTSFGNKRLAFHDVLTAFVANLKARAEHAAGAAIDHVVAGRPVHFVDANDKADAEAEAQLEAIYTAAGFRHIQFQYEPLAAAFAHEAQLGSREYLAFVMDIGGGTSDFAIARLSGSFVNKKNRRKDILASAGVRVGGNDFDRVLSHLAVMPLLGKNSLYGDKALPFPAAPFHDLSEWSRIQYMYTRAYRQKIESLMTEAHAPELVGRLLTVVDEELGHSLMATVEECKIDLSGREDARMDLVGVEAGLAASANRSEFEVRLAPNIGALRSCIEVCLQRAAVRAEGINLVVLTGGATGMPILERLAREMFPRAELSAAERLSSVATGLAYTALQQSAGRPAQRAARGPATPRAKRVSAATFASRLP